jgi:CRP/FNR family cyclic AMP-dependent transcriptional regulator
LSKITGGDGEHKPMQKVRFAAGESLFNEGDPSDRCFKIVSGMVDIRLEVTGMMTRGRVETIASCGAGEIVGEMSVIDGAPRSASAIATEPTECLAFTAEEILDVLQNDPREAMAYVRTLIKRIRQGNKKMSLASGRHG